MPKIMYVKKGFRKNSLILIEKVNDIERAYKEQGFELTLRQLFYQLVSRTEIPNTDDSYDKLGALVTYLYGYRLKAREYKALIGYVLSY